MDQIAWHQRTIPEVVDYLHSDIDKGLSQQQVQKLQQIHSNIINQGERIHPLSMLLAQFTDTMVMVLLGATVISGLIGNMADAITILAIVILNACLGFIQEFRAERSLDEIKRMSSPMANVIRQGERIKLPAEKLVPGDIVHLEAGDKVPADLRLITAYALEIDEAPLTGESIPVTKHPAAITSHNIPLAETHNLAYMGTAVTRGRGAAIVVEVGMQTQMGHIAAMISETKPSPTPLQIRLDQLGKILIVICLVVCAGVAGMGIYRGESVITMLMTAISLAVAAIPEGLPAIVTVVLAVGVQRMAKNQAIIRRLSAVETLGCTNIICTDKTGTLTQNQMTVKKIASLDRSVDVTGNGYEPKGVFTSRDKPVNPLEDPALGYLLLIARVCNNAVLENQGGHFSIQGDPTEGALHVMAAKANMDKRPVSKIREIPFDSERKLMSVVIHLDSKHVILVKGALDELLLRCNEVMAGGCVRPIGPEDRARIQGMHDQWAQMAMRVLGFAFRILDPLQTTAMRDNELENRLVLVGICGIMDPPRQGVMESVQQCHRAGIIPVMITGDHPLTARAVAGEIGIGGSGVVTGREIDHISDNQLYDEAVKTRIFARVSPQHKHRIVKILKRMNHVVAMTGDGINDAPALKAADIGIAMGISGTEVTKEASAMVLADDDFSTIIKAVYEGRAIYDNIRKFIRYLLGCNIGEVLVMFFASLLGMPLPMLPIQILWVNLVTDGLPAMALGLEPPEPGIMERKPRPRHEGIFARGLGWVIVGRGSYIAVITLLAFTIGIAAAAWQGETDSLILARTMAFSTLVLAQLCYVFECRSERLSPFELGFFGNRFLVGAVGLSILMQLAVVYLPFLQQVFETCPLNWWQWTIILVLAGSKLMWKLVLYQCRHIQFKHVSMVQ